MRRKSNVVVCLITALVVLTGCGTGKEITSLKGSDVTTIETKGNTGENTTDNVSETAELTMLTDNVWQESYSTEQGWYYINDAYQLDSDNDNQAIMYVDYKSGKNVYLCNKVNCKHNSKDCNAVLPEDTSRTKALFGQGEYLYVATTDYDQSGSMSSGTVTFEEGAEGGMNVVQEPEVVPPVIYRMKLDGTEREKVMELDSGMVLETKFFGDGENIYGVQKKVKSETKDNTTYSTGYDRELVKFDLKNKKIEKIMDLDEETQILGCAGRKLLTVTTDYGKKMTTEEKQKDDDLYKKAKYIYKSVDIDSGKTTEMKTVKGAEAYREMVSGSKLYVSNDKESKIDVIDFLTNKKEEIKTKIPLSIEKVITKKDGTDVLQCILFEYSDSDNRYYLVDTETKKVKEGALKTSGKAPIDIMAQNSDKLLVISDYKEDTEYVAWVGVHQDYISEEEFSIISKEDYLNNQPNYKKVKMIGMKASKEE